MEENNPRPHALGKRSEETAEKLRTLRAQADEKLNAQRRHLSDIETELNHRIRQVAEELAHDLAQSPPQNDSPAAERELQAQLEQAIKERDHLIDDLAQLNSQLHESNHLLEEETGALQRQESEHEHAREQLLRLASELAESREALDSLRSESDQQRDQLQQQLAASEEKYQDQLRQWEATQTELAESQQSLQELLDEQKKLEDAHRQSNQGEADLRSRCEELQQRLEAAEKDCGVQCAQIEELEKQHDQACSALQEALAKQEEQARSLSDTESRLHEYEAGPRPEEELEELRHKFELALEDAQKLKRQNAELLEELSHRPEPDKHESPELASLRVERDALAERVAELENSPPPAIDADREQEFLDMQQRFEMAVDDVRQLKRENADLHHQIAAAPTPTAAPVDDGAMDWQAQKARLLASLAEEDGEPIPEPRRAERTTIEGTISITDRVISDKDCEIAELQAKLESLQNKPPTEVSQEQVQQAFCEELFDKDEAIREERARLEELQTEWEKKLRQAELDISIERATLAREQAALEEKLGTIRAMPANNEKSGDGKPRRRWLAALGIKDDENED